MNEKIKAVISANITAEDLKELDLLTRFTGRNRQYHIREALKRYLADVSKNIPNSFKNSIQ